MSGALRSVTRRSGHRGIMALALFLAIAVLPSEAAAQWGGEVRAQMGFGGDEYAKVSYSDGSESGLTLGKYLAISGGPIFTPWSSGASMIELQAMVGWSGWSTGPQNTDDRLKLVRFPVELLAFYGYHVPELDFTLRFGGGGTYHFGGGVKGTGSLKAHKADFENALGYTGEIAMVRGTFTAGLRYTSMDATIKGATVPMDASSIGLFVGITSARKDSRYTAPLPVVQ